MSTQAQLQEILAHHTAPAFAQPLLAYIRPCVRLEPMPDQVVPLGGSKFGGAPHLPRAMAWPESPTTKKPYAFLAQINLVELQQCLPNAPLPSNGWLYFFINMDEPLDVKVLHQALSEPLEVAPIPSFLQQFDKSLLDRLLWRPGIQWYLIPEVGVALAQHYCLPTAQTLTMRRVVKATQPNVIFEKVSIYDPEVYDADLFDETGQEKTDHHLLGFPHLIQESGFHENVLLPPDKKAAELSLAELDELLQWQLLFQCDSDTCLNLSWGDWGRVYFYMHNDDLAVGDFDRVRVYWDCY